MAGRQRAGLPEASALLPSPRGTKPDVCAFHDWMPSEVLPAISKDGVPAAAASTPFQWAAMARIGKPLLAYRAVLCDSLAAFLARS
jgi:hypothetical protein